MGRRGLGCKRAQGHETGLDVDVQEVHIDRLLTDAAALQSVNDALVCREGLIGTAKVLISAERPRQPHHGTDVAVIREDCAHVRLTGWRGLLAEVRQNLLCFY